MATERTPKADRQPQGQGPSDALSTDAAATVDKLLTYVRRRMEATDVTAEDLSGLDMDSEAFRTAMRHGMATAFHELEHLLMDAHLLSGERPLPIIITHADGSTVTLDDAYFRAMDEARRARLAATPLSEPELAEMRERHPDESWIWTRETQDSLRRTEKDIEAGHFTRFYSDEDFLRSFDDLDVDADV